MVIDDIPYISYRTDAFSGENKYDYFLKEKGAKEKNLIKFKYANNSGACDFCPDTNCRVCE